MNNDAAFKERVYRLVYVVSQFPILRSALYAAMDDTESAAVSELFVNLWGTSETAFPQQLFSALLRANQGSAERKLVDLADLRRIMGLGLQRGFYIADQPPGLRGKANLQELRREAAGSMIPESSRIEALNDRLESGSNPLWFVMQSHELAASAKSFREQQWTEFWVPKLTEMRGKTDSELKEEVDKWFQGVVLPSSTVSHRASKLYLCTELALASGLLQVVVVDDAIGADGKLTQPSANALRFRNAFPEAKTVDDLYDAWIRVMKAHDTTLRVLRGLLNTITELKDSRYQALAYSLRPIPSISAKDQSWTVTPGQDAYSSTRYKSSIRKILQRVGNRAAAGLDAGLDALDAGRHRVGTGIDAMGARLSAIGGRLMSKTEEGEEYRFANWLEEYVERLRLYAGQVFVFNLPEDGGSQTFMRPGWHLYCSRDHRSGTSNASADEAKIKAWMEALVKTGIETNTYSPVDQRSVNKCKTVVERAAEMLGMKGDDTTKLVEVACNASGSCLDRQYEKVRDLPGSSQDRSDALVRSLLNYNALGCDDEKVDAKPVAQILCERRVARACEGTSEVECGAPLDKDGNYSVSELQEELCNPTQPLRNRLANECVVPPGDPVDGIERFKKDAECMTKIVEKSRVSQATCKKDIERMCDEGRSGWCLLRAIEDEKSPLGELCRDYTDLEQLRRSLQRLRSSSKRPPSICGLMQHVMEEAKDPRLSQLAGKMYTESSCKTVGINNINVRDANGLKKIVEDMENARGPDPNSDPKWLKWSLVLSPEEYDYIKTTYANEERASNPSTDDAFRRLKAIMSLIQVQCVGMESANAADLLSKDTSKFANRMLLKKFQALTTLSVDPPFYEKVVGMENVDWFLIVLGHYTKIQRNLDGDEDTIKSRFDQLKQIWRSPHDKLLTDPLVRKHLFERLFKSTLGSNEVDGQMELKRLSMDVTVISLISTLKELGTVDTAYGRLLVNHPKIFKNILLSVKGEPLDHAFNDERLEAFDNEDKSWWRQILTIALFAPHMHEIARSYLNTVFENREVTTVKWSEKSWTLLYAALLCIASSSQEISFAQTMLIDAMERKNNDYVNDVEINLKLIEGKHETKTFENLQPLQGATEFNAIQDDARKIMLKLLYLDFEDAALETRKKEEKEKVIKDFKDTKASLLSARLNTPGLQHKVSDAVQNIPWTTLAAGSAAAIAAVVSGYALVPVAAAPIYTPVGYGFLMETGMTAASTAVSGSAVAGIAAGGAAANAASESTWLGNLKKKLANIWQGQKIEINENAIYVTTEHMNLYNRLKGYKKAVADEIVFTDIALSQFLVENGLYDQDSANVISEENVKLLSELIHMARFGAINADVDGLDPEHLSINAATHYQDLLPTVMFAIKGALTYSPDDALLVLEYTRALKYALSAFVSINNPRSQRWTDEDHIKARYRACFPLGRKQDTAGAFANALQDFQKEKLFVSDPRVEATARLHLFGVAKYRPRGMHYIPLSMTDQLNVEKLARGIDELKVMEVTIKSP